MRGRRFFATVSASVLLAALASVVPLSTGGAADAAAAAGRPIGSIAQVGTLEVDSASQYQDWNWANPDPVYEYRTAAGELGIVRYNRDQLTLTASMGSLRQELCQDATSLA